MALAEELVNSTLQGSVNFRAKNRQLRLLHEFLRSLSSSRHSPIYAFKGDRGRRRIRWLIALSAIAAMWLWNWKLFLATAAGVGIMLSVYLLQERKWQTYLLNLQRFYKGYNRQLTLAVGSGGVAAFTTYLGASIWADSENRWLATGVIFQSLISLFTLVLLSWYILFNRKRQDETNFDRLLSDLTHVDPLKRLIAVRQLTNSSDLVNLKTQNRDRLIEYFRLMLSQEQELTIRTAILDSLQMWGIQDITTRDNRPLQIPLKLESSPQKLIN